MPKIHTTYSWLYAILIAIDQLGNALAGGYPDTTISARVGYNALHSGPLTRRCWCLLQVLIDYTFLPLDGPRHCYQAYQADKNHHYRDGSDLMRLILSVLVVANAPLIIVATRLIVLFR